MVGRNESDWPISSNWFTGKLCWAHTQYGTKENQVHLIKSREERFRIAPAGRLL